MDEHGETQLFEFTSDARHARNKLPESPHSQSTLIDCPSPTRTLSKRKSLRARPTDLLEQQHAIPPLPLRTRASQPELRPRPSKMSLFSLFSKPKVEKLRGYAESGLDAPPRAFLHSAAPSRKGSVRRDGEAGTRPTTASKSYSARASRIMTRDLLAPQPPVPQVPADHRTFEPLPLFQVWPQAIRHGTFEASMIAPEIVLQKNRQRLAGSPLSFGGDGLLDDAASSHRVSGDPRATVMTAFRSGSVGLKSEDTSRKVFILVTSGYLLQYAEGGASDRMPEKVLKLGKNSAAFASDLIPGKHHVLQVSQTVDAQGGLVNDRQSIFSKLSLRSHTPRRTASNFLIIMPGPKELGEWLTAIRQEIQQQGGKMTPSESPTEQRPRTGVPPKLDLQKTPSQSHRYQVKRDPSKVLSVISPLGDTFQWFPSPLQSPVEEKTTVTPAAAAGPQKTETDSVHSRSRTPSDSPSLASSTGRSVEQQQLEKLRDSTRISHTSTAATTATSPSRANSITSSPPSDQARDVADGDPKSPYRSLSSYSLAKRRSAVPIALKEVPTLSSPEGLLQNQRRIMPNPIVESPQISPSAEVPPSYGKNLSMARSVPNLHAKLDRHDSKVASPVSSSRERPESFLGDLPDTTAWLNKTSPSHQRSSFSQQSPVRERSSPLQARPTNSRNPSLSFSLPLRVNTIDQTKRMSANAGEETDVLSPIPAVHVLNATVNAAERIAIDAANVSTRNSSSDRRASTRLSLFPTPEPSTQQRPQSASANTTLRRPTSLQVRNPDQAAFLSSSRSYPTPRVMSQQRSVTTVPIRRLKPSRSLQTISSESVPRNFSRQSSISTVDDEDRVTTLPFQRRISPPGTRSTSRTRSTVIQGDFTIPLGPPAPPPCAPLPDIPPPGARSRSKSPMPKNIGLAIGDFRAQSALSIREE